MRKIGNSLGVLMLLVIGYVAGSVGLVSAPGLSAQDKNDDAGPSKDAVLKITAGLDAIKVAADALKREGRYNPATRGLNLFGVSVGGLNARDDLDKGRGVDPETFAALYAGQASGEVEEHIARDDQGRVTYKGKVVRLYPISRLIRLFKERAQYAGDEAAP